VCVCVCVCVCVYPMSTHSQPGIARRFRRPWASQTSALFCFCVCFYFRKPALFFGFIFIFIFAGLAHRKPALCRHTLAFLVPISVVNANKFYITTHNCNSLQSTQSDCQHMLALFVCQMRRRIHACMSNEEEDTCMSAHVSIICNLTTN